MIPARFLAQQLGRPSGIWGKFILPRLWNKRNADLNDLVFESLALSPHDRVLEVGFGGGYLLSQMSAVITSGLVAGVDVSPAIVAFCQKRYRSLIKTGKLELKCATAESLPYPSGHFTKACSVNSLFYWQDTPQVFSEIWRVLANEGLLVLCFTSKKSLADKKFTQQDNIILYEAAEIEQMMAAAGFQQIRTRRAVDQHREFLCITGRKLN